MHNLVEYVHGKGLLFGLYGDRGWKTCAFRPGSGGLEGVHAAQFARWGVDYLKYDSCWASNDHQTAFKQYAAMRDALNATGRPILYSLCGWNVSAARTRAVNQPSRSALITLGGLGCPGPALESLAEEHPAARRGH